MSKIKLCSLRRLEDVDFANEVKPDYAGVILADPDRFHRAISREQAKAIRARLFPSIPLIGVFVNNSFNDVVSYVHEDIINMVQLHGSEPDDYINAVRFNAGVPVFKAFQIRCQADVEQAVRSRADQVLLDSGSGSGKTFDWSVASHVRRPFILAGGLNPENLEQAIAQTHPWAVDISSGVETDGVKDLEKMRKAVEIAHSHW